MAALRMRLLIPALMLTGLSACGPSYSPDTYASNAAQQANKVEQGIIVGVRNVAVTAAGTVGTVTGAAAGGIAGSQVAGGATGAFTALGGSLVGGIAGASVEHMASDTTAFEYIVRKHNGELVSVTQKDKDALKLGQSVLVITGVQARIVPDYTVPPDVALGKPAEAPKSGEAKPADAAPLAASVGGAPADTKPAETGPVDARPGDAQPTAATPDQARPAASGDGSPGLSPASASPAGGTDIKPALAESRQL